MSTSEPIRSVWLGGHPPWCSPEMCQATDQDPNDLMHHSRIESLVPTLFSQGVDADETGGHTAFPGVCDVWVDQHLPGLPQVKLHQSDATHDAAFAYTPAEARALAAILATAAELADPAPQA